MPSSPPGGPARDVPGGYQAVPSRDDPAANPSPALTYSTQSSTQSGNPLYFVAPDNRGANAYPMGPVSPPQSKSPNNYPILREDADFRGAASPKFLAATPSFGAQSGSPPRMMRSATTKSQARTLRRSASRYEAPPLRRMLTTSHSHPGYASGGGAQTPVALKKRNPWSPPNVWVAFSWMMTCCCPGFCLAGIVKGGAGPQQAWREKVALCWIVFFMSAFVAFFILAFNKLLCPTSKLENNNVPVSIYGGVMVRGTMFNILNATKPYNTLFSDLAVAFPGIDVTTQFSQPSSEYTQCVGLSNSWATVNYTCEADNTCIDVRHLMYPDQSVMGIYPYNKTSDGTALKPNPLLSWSIVKARGLVVYKDIVLNFQPYLQQHPVPDLTDDVDIMIRTASAINDATHLVARNPNLKDSQTIACLSQKYYAGQLDILPSECMTSLVVTYMATALVLSIVIVRFVMAVVFNWFIANKLSRKPKPDSLREREYYEKQPTVPFLRKIEQEEFVAAGGGAHGKRVSAISAVSAGSSQRNLLRKSAASPFIPTAAGAYDTDLHTVLLVTCYSEGEQSMRNTLESLVATDYHDEKKLLFVICDGVITGKGEAQSTPDIVLGLIELDDDLGGNPKPYSYVAVASGSKQHNMAKVYCGNYVFKGRAVPTVVVVKCGTPAEASSAKPGNRGKRDSQLILMNFFSRVVLQDRMTPLDYDMFRKIHHITGFTPDYYEILLMVDADTMVHPDSLRAMTNCMYNNPMVMGLCGETKIDNKRTSWVTMIQVFEYYISHHLGKAFESVFGGVTCLPGCFCMYRIKARKGDEWIPIVVAPDIVSEYSTNEVETLHQKNLLLLGEDRFLTTLMLRQFPKRKQVFVPGAICRTTVPDDFKTLLSQRRRWINSTIHNLMELVLLRDLCGTFCFSMQFIVLMDLIGTAILPISLLLLYYMIYVAIFQTHYVASEAATYSNTILLVGVLFMPAFLVVLVSRKMSLIMWMLLYLVALPIWQFVLPLYAFWNFDDFSWGATRQVAGAGKDTGHGESGGADDRFDPASVPFRKWEEYEVEWRQRVNTQRLAIKRAADAAAAGGRDSPALSVPSSGYHHGAPRLRSRLSGLSLGTTMTDGTVDSASASPFEDIDFE